MQSMDQGGFTVGLTGGIASGKTSVSDRFAKLGVPIVDADIFARKVVEPGSDALQQLVSLFNDTILNSDGSLDRKALRNLIFNNDKARADVEAILHPAIRSASEAAIRQHHKQGCDYVINAIPLLVETGQSDRFDHVLVVDVPESLQLDRIISRDKVTQQQAKKILASQATREQRLAIADDIISNTGTLEDLDSQIALLHRRFCELALAKRKANRQN